MKKEKSIIWLVIDILFIPAYLVFSLIFNFFYIFNGENPELNTNNDYVFVLVFLIVLSSLVILYLKKSPGIVSKIIFAPIALLQLYLYKAGFKGVVGIYDGLVITRFFVLIIQAFLVLYTIYHIYQTFRVKYMKVNVHIFNSFAKSFEGGNPAGVVFDYKNDLDDATMQSIATKVGLSETAFIRRSGRADYELRFFTPNAEVDLCGHATIAAFSYLKNTGKIQAKEYLVETKAGILQISADNYGFVFMEQNLPQYFGTIPFEEIASCFNITEDSLIKDLPVEVVSTGLKDIILPIRNLATLENLKPDFEQIKEISKKYDVIGIHAFTLKTLGESTAHCRNFAPLYGIDEESATGTANGALTCYLSKYGLLETVQESKIEQGYVLGKPSEIITKLLMNNGEIVEVRVGGRAVQVEERLIDVN